MVRKKVSAMGLRKFWLLCADLKSCSFCFLLPGRVGICLAIGCETKTCFLNFLFHDLAELHFDLLQLAKCFLYFIPFFGNHVIKSSHVWRDATAEVLGPTSHDLPALKTHSPHNRSTQAACPQGLAILSTSPTMALSDMNQNSGKKEFFVWLFWFTTSWPVHPSGSFFN